MAVAIYFVLLLLITQEAYPLPQCDSKCQNYINDASNPLLPCYERRKITLCCNGCGLSKVPEVANKAQWLSLDLSDNRIRALNNGSFLGFDALEELDLSKNKVENIDPGAFMGLSRIKYLNLHDQDDCMQWKTDNSDTLATLKYLDITQPVRNGQLTNFDKCYSELLHDTVSALSNLTKLHIAYFVPFRLPTFEKLCHLDAIYVQSSAWENVLEIQDATFNFSRDLSLLDVNFVSNNPYANIAIWENATLPFETVQLTNKFQHSRCASPFECYSSYVSQMLRRKPYLENTTVSGYLTHFDKSESGSFYRPSTRLEGEFRLQNFESLHELYQTMSTRYLHIFKFFKFFKAKFYFSAELGREVVDPENVVSVCRSFSEEAQLAFTRSTDDWNNVRHDPYNPIYFCEKHRRISLFGEYLSVTTFAETSCVLYLDYHLKCNISDELVCNPVEIQNFIFTPRNYSVQSFMRFLNLADTPLGSLTIPDQDLSSLLYLNLSNCMIDFINPDFLRLPNLTVLDISNNPLRFCAVNNMDHCISSDTWQHIPQLKQMYMNDLFLNQLPLQLLQTILSLEMLFLSKNEFNELPLSSLVGMPNLTHMDLSQNKIKSIDFRVTNNARSDFVLSNLKHLNLSRNDIQYLDVHTLKHIPELEYLDVSNNDIESFSSDVMEFLASHPGKLEINITYNPLKCQCKNVGAFRMMANFSTHFVGLSDTACMLKNGSYMEITDKMLKILEDECNAWKVVLGQVLYIILAAVGFFGLLGVLGFLYKRRWQIARKYLTWRDKKLFEIQQSAGEENEAISEYEFDAFVSHNHQEDYDWVVNTLLSKLEDEAGLKLYLGERDFMGGVPIMENIVSAVNTSRHTIIVLTPAFLSSTWCEMELQLALAKGLHHPIVVVLDPEALTSKNLSKTIRQVLKTATYLDYPMNNPEAQDCFWLKLNRAVSQ